MNDCSYIPESEAKPVSYGANVLVSECSWEKLFTELQQILEQMGFVYFSYSSVARDLGQGESLFSLTKRRYGVDTLGTLPADVVNGYYRAVATHDPLWSVLPAAEGPVFASQKDNTSSLLVDNYWEQQGVLSRVYIPVGLRQEKCWFNYFGLYHSLSAKNFSEVYGKVSASLVPLLERCHKLLQLDSGRETNPYLCHSVFSDTCRRILHYTAEGLSVKLIAVKLGLTEEGVTYHITRTKRVLKARNKAQLIATLYKSGIL